jgi:hypothetical protein
MCACRHAFVALSHTRSSIHTCARVLPLPLLIARLHISSCPQSETSWLRGFDVDDYDIRIVGGGRESPPAPVFLIRLSIVSSPSSGGGASSGPSHSARFGGAGSSNPSTERMSCGLAEVLVTISLDTGDVRDQHVSTATHSFTGPLSLVSHVIVMSATSPLPLTRSHVIVMSTTSPLPPTHSHVIVNSTTPLRALIVFAMKHVRFLEALFSYNGTHLMATKYVFRLIAL